MGTIQGILGVDSCEERVLYFTVSRYWPVGCVPGAMGWYLRHPMVRFSFACECSRVTVLKKRTAWSVYNRLAVKLAAI